jgi:4-amino-4-deoxy-L-arabinose transferase-like glycosyltransferase
MNKKTFYESDKNPLLILSLLCLILYFTNIGGWDLWAPDEPKFGQITREMLQTNDWFVMHVNREPYSDKPPLFFWLVGLRLAFHQHSQV